MRTKLHAKFNLQAGKKRECRVHTQRVHVLDVKNNVRAYVRKLWAVRSYPSTHRDRTKQITNYRNDEPPVYSEIYLQFTCLSTLFNFFTKLLPLFRISLKHETTKNSLLSSKYFK